MTIFVSLIIFLLLSYSPTSFVWFPVRFIDPQSELAFRKHNPDGDKYQNCFLVREKGLLDTDCKKHSCTACHTTAGGTWTLRGTCEEEEVRMPVDTGNVWCAVKDENIGLWDADTERNQENDC